ncbi:uncharacterized protein [Mycetomoellerius zeteki]|uniref:uncharacterized protein n=1 Tax=Mycetomoellerius zeteki TaxID=64791 RepID=UPI00084E83A3|nr:PREDICTED: uncharacterized protein LOC108720967 [Trachymyrmex zeteki]
MTSTIRRVDKVPFSVDRSRRMFDVMFGSPFSSRTQCAELPKLRRNTRPVDANTAPSGKPRYIGFPTFHESSQGRTISRSGGRMVSVIELNESVRLPGAELLIIPTDSHVHRCKQPCLNAKCVDVHTNN